MRRFSSVFWAEYELKEGGRTNTFIDNARIDSQMLTRYIRTLYILFCSDMVACRKACINSVYLSNYDLSFNAVIAKWSSRIVRLRTNMLDVSYPPKRTVAPHFT